jgi:hypothetical protein
MYFIEAVVIFPIFLGILSYLHEHGHDDIDNLTTMIKDLHNKLQGDSHLLSSCSTCGNPSMNDAIFCSKCGSALRHK